MKSKKISANTSAYIALVFGLLKCVTTGPVPCTLSCVQESDCKKPTCMCPKGFSKHPIFPRLCNPICSEPCVNGTCIQPEVCACKRGFSLSQGNKYECVSKCTTPCKNGICLSSDVCTCKKGYELDRSNRFQCNPKHAEGCVKNGKTNELKCPEKPQTCSRSCTNGRCVGNETCECFKGFTLDDRNKYHCIPICTQGCQNGICSSPEICSCNVGFVLDVSNTFKCNPKCSENCLNGQCIAPDTCECKEGYLLDSDNIYKCIAEFKPVNFLNSSATKKDTIQEGKENQIRNLDNSKVILDIIKYPEETANVTEDISIPTIDNGVSSKHPEDSEPSENIDEEMIKADGITESSEEQTTKIVETIEQTYSTNSDINLKNANNYKDTVLESIDFSTKDETKNTVTTNADINLENDNNSEAAIIAPKDVLIKNENGVETIITSTTNTLEVATMQTEKIFSTSEDINNYHYKNSKTPLHESENILIEETATETIDYDDASKDRTTDNIDKKMGFKETTESGIKENLEAYTKRSAEEIINHTESIDATAPASNEEVLTTIEESDPKPFDDLKVDDIDLNQIKTTENTEEHTKVILDAVADSENTATTIKSVPQEQTTSDLQKIISISTEETFTSNNELDIGNSDTVEYQENTIKCDSGYVLNGKRCIPHCSKRCVNSFCSSPDFCTCTDSFRHDPNDKYKCVPKCSKGCVNSVCAEGDKCLCTEGFIPDTSDPFRCNKPEKSFSCAKRCVNGKCTGEDVCGCNPGYEKDPEDDSSCVPSCITPCVNGRCVAPEVCRCHERFEFNDETKACELKDVKSKSFLKSAAATLTRKIYGETICLMAAIGTSYFGNSIFRF